MYGVGDECLHFYFNKGILIWSKVVFIQDEREYLSAGRARKVYIQQK